MMVMERRSDIYPNKVCVEIAKMSENRLQKYNHRICSKVVGSRIPTIFVSMGITHLGSGSRGNSVLLSTPESNVLIDCGFSLKKLSQNCKS